MVEYAPSGPGVGPTPEQVHAALLSQVGNQPADVSGAGAGDVDAPVRRSFSKGAPAQQLSGSFQQAAE